MQDLFVRVYGLGPHEWPLVLVPAFDPGADIGFEGLDALAKVGADHLVGQVPEQSSSEAPPRIAEVNSSAWREGAGGFTLRP